MTADTEHIYPDFDQYTIHKQNKIIQMTTINVKIKLGSDNSDAVQPIMPQYAHEGDAGMDVRAYMPDSFFNNDFNADSCIRDDNYKRTYILQSGLRTIIPTGLYVALPKNYEFQARPRSGMSIKTGVTVLNTPGTIDEPYRKEIGIILINHSSEPFVITEGDRIAQIVPNEIPTVEWQLVDSLDETDRGAGFGSSGIK